MEYTVDKLDEAIVYYLTCNPDTSQIYLSSL